MILNKEDIKKITAANEVASVDNVAIMRVVNGTAEYQSHGNTMRSKAVFATNSNDMEWVGMNQKYLQSTLKVLPAPISMEFFSKEKRIRLSSGDAKFDLLMVDKASIVPLKHGTPVLEQTFTKEGFESVFKRMAQTSSTDDGRPIFTGIGFRAEGGRVYVNATDTHALTHTEWGNKKTEDFGTIVVPSAFFKLKLLGDVEFAIGTKFAALKSDGVEYISSALEGSAPAYESVIPKTDGVVFRVHRAELSSALDKISICSSVGETVPVRMVFKDGKLTLSAFSPSLGKVEDAVHAVGGKQGEEYKIAFTTKYANQILLADSEEITLHYYGVLKPLKVEDDKLTIVVTPVRTKD